ncbi:periplasmic ATP/GTP-binding protein [Fulvivirga imtechensis AK7]|uniref:Periplasmic ATP/GTP-binding protein n=1 Tax=Fulvivirga imtechensis AK7 TaxID=1237149 RepID=L8JNR8_9BACT|nr:periplasmic ATP/GTP-binding protein [Fulvivirga imtechensis AK7]
MLYDKERNVLFVSNISGKPTEKDGVGFISKQGLDGSDEQLEWVKGLDAPKGMAILNDNLYVTNIDELVEINIAEGTITNRYPVEGAQFLNDVATDGKHIYFSDMSTGKIHMMEDGQVSVFKEGIENINGLAFNQQGELYGLDGRGLRKFPMEDGEPEVINDVVTGGDGLVIINDNTFIASRWQGEIYLIQNGKETLLLDTKDQNSNTADIGYIPEEQLVLVPTFFANKVVAYKLSY